jgi:hypothetical protein
MKLVKDFKSCDSQLREKRKFFDVTSSLTEDVESFIGQFGFMHEFVVI